METADRVLSRSVQHNDNERHCLCDIIYIPYQTKRSPLYIDCILWHFIYNMGNGHVAPSLLVVAFSIDDVGYTWTHSIMQSVTYGRNKSWCNLTFAHVECSSKSEPKLRFIHQCSTACVFLLRNVEPFLFHVHFPIVLILYTECWTHSDKCNYCHA